LSGQPIAVSNTGTNALTIYGTSIADSNYNAIHNCRVSILLNNMLPYQTALPIGINGRDDYSKWMYSIMPFSIRSGLNTITAKLSCFTPFHTSFDSINIMGTSSHLQGIRDHPHIGPTPVQPIFRDHPHIGPTPTNINQRPIGPIAVPVQNDPLPTPLHPKFPDHSIIGPTPVHPTNHDQSPTDPVPGSVQPPTDRTSASPHTDTKSPNQTH
jgi:hypothetical protein